MVNIIACLANAKLCSLSLEDTQKILRYAMNENINSENFYELNPTIMRRASWWFSKEYKVERRASGWLIANERAKVVANGLVTKTCTTVDDVDALARYLNVALHAVANTTEKIEPQLAKVYSNYTNKVWKEIHLRPLLPNKFIPNLDSANKLHQLHESEADPFQVAYYPTLRHMREGREVRTRLGKYLTTYASLFELSESDIKAMSEKHRSEVAGRGNWQVGFVSHDDEAGWLNTYRSEKVNSCMQSMDAVRIYAHEKSTLRLARVTQANGDVIARCIVRDEGDKTGWVRVYPDPNGYSEGKFLLDYLNANGYPERTNLNGVLMQYIQDSDGIVCPYLDSGSGGRQSVSIETHDGKQYLVAGGSDYEACNTNGYTEEYYQCTCDECGDGMDEEDGTYIERDDRTVCEYCRDNHYTYAYGRRHQDYYLADDCIECQSDGEYYLVEYADVYNVYRCEVTDNWYYIDDLCATSRGLAHVDEVTRLDHEDSDGNDYAYNADTHELSDGTICHEDDADRLQAEIDENEDDSSTQSDTLSDSEPISLAA